jgi:DNA-binding LacI/PurR family transcriptional regulator
MGVTRKDIAERAGVSASTVGMILGGRGKRYSEETQRKVRKIAEQLDYRVDMAARSLKLNRSFLVGVLLYSCNDVLAMDFLRGSQSALAEQGCSPIVFSHDNVEEEIESLQRCLDRRVDGLIVNVTAAGLVDEPIKSERYQSLLQSDLPVVQVLGRCMPGVPSVIIDNVAAARDATAYLIGLEHRRIALLMHDHYDNATIYGMAPHFDAWQRYDAGYHQAMQDAGLEPVVITHRLVDEPEIADQYIRGGLESFESIVHHESRPTAVVCYNDFQAFGLIRAARLRNIIIPDQLSIIGHADHDLSSITTPTVTTLSVPAWQVGRAAAEMVLRKINEDVEAEDVLIRSELRVRGSTTKLQGLPV